MKKIAILTFLIPFSIFGQKNTESKSAVELIREGIRLYDNESYYDAINKFRQVSVNDTNYCTAQYETALTYLKMEEYVFAEKILKELINLEVSYPNRAQAYVLLGQAYDGDKKLDEALKTYAEGLEKYPANAKLYFSRATTYEKYEKYQESLEDYKRSAQYDITHASTHLRLGVIAAREGHFTESILSLMTFLILEPRSERAAGVVSLLEQICDGSYTPEPRNITISKEGDNYEDLNLFITNKVALQEKYKAKFTISTSYARQLHLILSSVKYNKNDEGYWHQMYLPFYLDIFESKLLDGMVLFSLQSVNSEKIQKKLSSSKKISDNFFEKGGAKWKEHITSQYMEFEGKKQHVFAMYGDDGLQAIGKLNDKKLNEGNFYYYHYDGGLNLIAKFDAEGKRTGAWTWRDYFTQKIKEETIYEKGIANGVSKIFYPTGELKQKLFYKNNVLQDTIYNYYRSGDIEEKITLKDGLRNGLNIGYHPNGMVSWKVDYINGEPNGKYVAYHLNGKIARELDLVNGEITGSRKTWYSNGQLESESQYNAEGKTFGPYKNWFPSGQLEEEGSLKDGKSIGQEKEFYSNGQPYSTSVFDESGKENGSRIYYDYDGKKYEEYTFKKGSLEDIIVYNKKGEVVEKISKSGKKINFKSHFPNGRTYSEGLLLEDKKSGTWKYYDQYGNISYTEKYLNGELSDTTFGFHPNGKIKYQIVYKNGLKNGLYLEYDLLGTLIQEGYFKDDERSNDWYEYDSNGDIEVETCYKGGEMHGVQKRYAVNGTLANYDIYDEGEIIASIVCDTAGNVMQRFGVFHGDVALRDANNTYIRFKSSYKNGASDGKATWQDISGKVTTEGNFVNNKRDGLWTWYHDNGKVKKTIMYHMGEIHGDFKEYSENGTLIYEGKYQNDKAQGPNKHYYDNGKLEYESTYMDDERHGRMTSYGIDGSVQQYRMYEKGVLISYSYLDKTGKEVEPIKLGPGTSKITTYYQSGQKSVEQTRYNGEINGTYTEFHPNGKTAMTGNYIYGERDGLFIEYYENGTKKLETNYKLGEKHGIETTYYPNGKVKSTQDFMFDEADGERKDYNDAGKLLKTSYYYNDELIQVTR